MSESSWKAFKEPNYHKNNWWMRFKVLQTASKTLWSTGSKTELSSGTIKTPAETINNLQPWSRPCRCREWKLNSIRRFWQELLKTLACYSEVLMLMGTIVFEALKAWKKETENGGGGYLDMVPGRTLDKRWQNHIFCTEIVREHEV